MSILNRPSDGLLSVLIALRNTVLAYGPLERQRLLELAAPPSVVPERKKEFQAHQTLKRWTQLGVFFENEDGVQLASPFKHIAADDINGLRRALLRVIVREASAPFLVDNSDEPDPGVDPAGAREYREKSLATDFVRSVCWVMAQDIYELYALNPNYATMNLLADSQRTYPRPFRNDTRWAGFKSWAPFLGFGEIDNSGHGARLLYAPHFALATVMDDVFESDATLTIETFLDRVAEQLPVVDGGRFRLQLEATKWVPPYAVGDRSISISLSAALLHLEQTGTLRLEAQSDAPTRRLLGHRARELEAISHVTRGVEA